jgi:hypothetical protein
MFCHDLKPRHVDDEREVSPGALQVQPVMMKKVMKLLSNLGLDVVFGKRRGDKTGQITVK